MLSIEHSLYQTLSYTHIFHYPLTLSELQFRLIWQKSDIVPSLGQLKQAVNQLLVERKIERSGPYYFLPHQKKRVFTRQQKTHWSFIRWQEVTRLKGIFRLLPWVKAVYVTGSLSMNNIHSPGDDIDVLVVTSARRLWLTRALTIVIFSWLGKYRLHDQHGQYQWCFNLWLDDHHLTLPVDQRNIYSAYEIIQAKQIFGAQNVLRVNNAWVGAYLASFNSAPTSQPKEVEKNRWPDLFDYLEQLAFLLQRMYMKRRQTIEKVGAGYAFFHPRPTAAIVLRQFMAHP